MKNRPRIRLSARLVKFNLVGAIGAVVQLGTLALVIAAFHLQYMVATVLAVESAVLHNFVWHERFTWADRGCRKWRNVSARLVRFNLMTGAVSIGGNLLLMRLLVGQLGMPTLLANLASVAGCSVLNFFVSDKWVFRPSVLPVVGTTHNT